MKDFGISKSTKKAMKVMKDCLGKAGNGVTEARWAAAVPVGQGGECNWHCLRAAGIARRTGEESCWVTGEDLLRW